MQKTDSILSVQSRHADIKNAVDATEKAIAEKQRIIAEAVPDVTKVIAVREKIEDAMAEIAAGLKPSADLAALRADLEAAEAELAAKATACKAVADEAATCLAGLQRRRDTLQESFGAIEHELRKATAEYLNALKDGHLTRYCKAANELATAYGHIQALCKISSRHNYDLSMGLIWMDVINPPSLPAPRADQAVSVTPVAPGRDNGRLFTQYSLHEYAQQLERELLEEFAEIGLS